MANGERLGEIIEAAVAQGQAPGVVAAVAQGDATYVKAAGNMAVGGAPGAAARRRHRAEGGNRRRDDPGPADRSAAGPGLAGFSFLGDRGWGYGVSVLADGSYTWEGGLGTTWANVPDQDLTVVVLTLAGRGCDRNARGVRGGAGRRPRDSLITARYQGD